MLPTGSEGELDALTDEEALNGEVIAGKDPIKLLDAEKLLAQIRLENAIAAKYQKDDRRTFTPIPVVGANYTIPEYAVNETEQLLLKEKLAEIARAREDLRRLKAGLPPLDADGKEIVPNAVDAPVEADVIDYEDDGESDLSQDGIDGDATAAADDADAADADDGSKFGEPEYTDENAVEPEYKQDETLDEAAQAEADGLKPEGWVYPNTIHHDAQGKTSLLSDGSGATKKVAPTIVDDAVDGDIAPTLESSGGEADVKFLQEIVGKSTRSKTTPLKLITPALKRK